MKTNMQSRKPSGARGFLQRPTTAARQRLQPYNAAPAFDSIFVKYADIAPWGNINFKNLPVGSSVRWRRCFGAVLSFGVKKL
jgi:hypothetical protein